MEDIKVILYIIGGILYFIFQFRKKAKDEVVPIPQKANKPKTAPLPEKKYKNVRSAIDELLEKGKNLEKTAVLKTGYKSNNLEKSSTEKIKQSKTRVTFKEAVSLEKNPNYHREEFDRTGNHFSQFDYKVKKKHPFLKSISTKEGVRNAFIASEILKPKFF